MSVSFSIAFSQMTEYEFIYFTFSQMTDDIEAYFLFYFFILFYI